MRLNHCFAGAFLRLCLFCVPATVIWRLSLVESSLAAPPAAAPGCEFWYLKFDRVSVDPPPFKLARLEAPNNLRWSLMDHSIDPERPRKRIKHAHGSLHQHVPQHTGYHYLRPTQHEDPSSAYANVANVATTMTNPNQAPHAWSQPKLYEDSWALPQPSSDSHLVLSFSSDQSAQDDEGWASSTG